MLFQLSYSSLRRIALVISGHRFISKGFEEVFSYKDSLKDRIMKELC